MKHWSPALHQSGIYQWLCRTSGKRYVGSAKKLGIRRIQHSGNLRRGEHPNIYLQRAWDKYGGNSFEFTILLICRPEDLTLYEQRAIDVLKPEFNILRTARSSLGRKYTPEGLAAVSEANRRRGADPAFRAMRSAAMKGVSPSAVTRARLSAALKGRPRPPEVIAKLQAAWARRREIAGLPPKPPGIPKPKKPIIAGRKGRKKDAAWRAALSASQKGRKKPRNRSSSNQLSLEV